MHAVDVHDIENGLYRQLISLLRNVSFCQGNFGLTIEVLTDSGNLITELIGHDESTASISSTYTNITLMDSHERKLDLRWRVVCATDYYGSNCSVYCKAMNDSGGHYTCDSNGNKECLRGWVLPGSNCTILG